MILERVERHIFRKESLMFSAIDEMCYKSKNLYNYVNYILRQSFINTGRIPTEYTLCEKFRRRKN